jgi:hypothetical protein
MQAKVKARSVIFS